VEAVDAVDAVDAVEAPWKQLWKQADVLFGPWPIGDYPAQPKAGPLFTQAEVEGRARQFS